MANALGKSMQKVFNVKDIQTKEELCDRVRAQFVLFQSEKLCTSAWKYAEEEMACPKRKWQQESYWPDALRNCGIEPLVNKSYLKPIDSFWHQMLQIVDNEGQQKYEQLFFLAKCCFTLSHGNADPERGFSTRVLYER